MLCIKYCNMITNLPLLQIIRSYSIKKNDSNLLLQELTDYIRRYAKHYLQQKPDLVQYVEITNEELLEIVKEFADEGVLSVVVNKKNVIVFVPYFYIENVDRIYQDIEKREDVPFPLASDLPASFPKQLTRKITFDDEFLHINPTDTNDFVYLLTFSGSAKSMLFPARYTADNLLTLCIKKIQLYFKKDETKDYLQKRLLIANPSKDATVRSFVMKIQSKDMGVIRAIKEADDNYLLWGQLCAFIKQDIDKKNEKLPDEEALLEAVSIVDFLNNHYRGAHQKDLQKQTALKNLTLAFQRPPYYFTIKTITDFVDSRGIPLLGQYNQTDLTDYLQKKTSICESFSVPDILTFRNSSGERFYVYADKVIPLLISLVTEHRAQVKDACVAKWVHLLKNFKQDASMKNNEAFNRFIKEMCEAEANNIYAILNAPFMGALVLDKKINDIQAGEIARLYPDGKQASYSEILMLSRIELLNDAKIVLPFYYTLPLISSIISLFVGRKKEAKAENKKEEQAPATKKIVKQKKTYKDVVDNLSHDMLPQGLSMEEALQYYLDLWNTNLNAKLRNNLTEDINSFIRDYLRNIQRRLPVSSVDRQRVEQLAETIVHTNSLAKIKDKKALKSYVEIYILKVISTYFQENVKGKIL
ncbi:MAG: hypothetical protein ACTTKH_02440 [Treponema sp.]